jgi:hypothetical protein
MPEERLSGFDLGGAASGAAAMSPGGAGHCMTPKNWSFIRFRDSSDK